MQETQEIQITSLGQEDPLEKEMATHFSTSCLGNLTERSLERYHPWGGKESDTMTKQQKYNMSSQQHCELWLIISVLQMGKRAEVTRQWRSQQVSRVI